MGASPELDESSRWRPLVVMGVREGFWDSVGGTLGCAEKGGELLVTGGIGGLLSCERDDGVAIG
jgi:hypothetical protein